MCLQVVVGDLLVVDLLEQLVVLVLQTLSLLCKVVDMLKWVEMFVTLIGVCSNQTPLVVHQHDCHHALLALLRSSTLFNSSLHCVSKRSAAFSATC